jgi:serine/threonine protein phosphatase PrpC
MENIKCSGHFELEVGKSKDSAGLPYMEDTLVVAEANKASVPLHAVLACVFDGHGTDAFAEHARDHLPQLIFNHPRFTSPSHMDVVLRSAFVQEDELLLEITGQGTEGGCTATCCLIYENWLFCANVGDSRAILVQMDGKVERLTLDHSVNLAGEKDRIQNAGGIVIGNRVLGMLNLTRSLADHHMKYPWNRVVCDGDPKITADFVSGEPYLCDPIDLRERNVAGIVLASDGVWNSVSDTLVAHTVISHRADQKSATQCAQHICKTAIKNFTRKQRDNVSCIVIYPVSFTEDMPSVLNSSVPDSS